MDTPGGTGRDLIGRTVMVAVRDLTYGDLYAAPIRVAGKPAADVRATVDDAVTRFGRPYLLLSLHDDAAQAAYVRVENARPLA